MSQNDKVVLVSHGEHRRREARAAAQAGILAGAVPQALCPQECAENDSLRALKTAQRGTLGYYRAEVARLRRNRPHLLQYVVAGAGMGITLMAATWWITDLILLEHHATTQYMDTALALRTLLLVHIVSCWLGWYARARFDQAGRDENTKQGR